LSLSVPDESLCRNASYALNLILIFFYYILKQVTIATAQSKPESVNPPIVTDVTSTVIKVKWTPPVKLNGIIKGYTLHVFSNGTVSSYQTTALTKTLTGKNIIVYSLIEYKTMYPR